MNKVMLIGNVGADPVVRLMSDQTTKVAQVRLATTKRGYTKQNGQQVPDKTTWHTLIFWRNLAEVVERYIHKGDKLFVEGEYESREYSPDKNNPSVKTTVYEVTVSNLEMLTPKSAQAAPAPSPAPMPMAPPAAPGYNNQYAQTGQYAPTAPAPAAPAPAPMPPHNATPQQRTIPFQQQVAGQPQAQQGAPVQATQQEWGDNSDLPF